MQRHNSVYELSTKRGVPWILIWSGQKESKSQVVKLEKKLKNLSTERTLIFMEKYHSQLHIKLSFLDQISRGVKSHLPPKTRDIPW